MGVYPQTILKNINKVHHYYKPYRHELLLAFTLALRLPIQIKYNVPIAFYSLDIETPLLSPHYTSLP